MITNFYKIVGARVKAGKLGHFRAGRRILSATIISSVSFRHSTKHSGRLEMDHRQEAIQNGTPRHSLESQKAVLCLAT
ncbi:MAG: hypothetical protein ABJB21_00375 [bacterium]